MELAEVMRTTFACRDFTDQPVSDTDIEAIVELARFAPSGGNRQPARVVAVRDPATKRALRQCAEPSMRVYLAQRAAGENPWNSVYPSMVDIEAIWNRSDPVDSLDYLEAAPVLLCIGADLTLIASLDRMLDRVGLVSGASVYPFGWNLLLAARDRGLGGVLTTAVAGQESVAQEILGFESHVAIAAVIALGHPTRQLTKLRRAPVADILRWERWDSEADPEE
jgi:nitroreductase